MHAHKCLETGLVEMVGKREKMPKSARDVRLESKSLLKPAWWPGVELSGSVGNFGGTAALI